MDTITTQAGQYTVPATSIVHHAQVSLTDRSPESIVHLTQYDTTMPIIAVALIANGQPYTVPTGAAVNVRLAKPDGTYVYNPALGISADAQTAYIGTTVQMTTVWGKLNAIVEIVLNGAVAGTGIFVLDITENPIPENAIESTSEFLTIQQILVQVQQAADLVQSQATNLQNLTDNLEAVQGAASNALAAQNAAEQAKQSASQALGFRTFFDAISPDANGSLDPSRPMTTAAAQASWTVKSKGDRIQSVQANGFTSGGQSGGLQMVEIAFTGGEDWGMATTSPQYGNVFLYTPSTPAKIAISAITAFFSIAIPIAYNNRTTLPEYWRCYVDDGGRINVRMPSTNPFNSAQAFKTFLQQKYANGTPLKGWYIPADTSQASSLYIPIQAQGHEYRCQCLPITEALSVGDNVQSNVASECDVKYIVTGNENWTLSSNGAFFANISSQTPNQKIYSNEYAYATDIGPAKELGRAAFIGTYGIYIYDKNYLNNLDGFKAFLQSRYSSDNPVVLWYQSSADAASVYNLSIETHASGAIYAHPAVELVAVPYTEADVSAAQQMAATPSTLPYIDSADVPMLLDVAEPVAAAASLASTLPVAGTYVVSSQNGTTVAVTLKAFQDGGDAATLGGMTAIEAMLNFVYPVGSIYMSANNVSPQVFLGGTWQQIQGQFLLAASSSYPAGSTGGEAEHTLTNEELPKYTNGQVYSGNTNANNVSSWLSVPEGTDMAYGALSLGGGQAHNNMPPYLAVYMWQRTA